MISGSCSTRSIPILTYGGKFPYPQALGGGFERTLVVDSLSKSFGMTGWRLGYLALPPGMAKALVKFLQHSIYCVPAFIQAAGAEALSLRRELVPQYRDMFRRRLERASVRLDAVPGIDCVMPDATFYLFPKVAARRYGCSAALACGRQCCGDARLGLRSRRQRAPQAVAELQRRRSRRSTGADRTAGRLTMREDNPMKNHGWTRRLFGAALIATAAVAIIRPRAGAGKYHRQDQGARQAFGRRQVRHAAVRLPRRQE